jgi:hypothetical protein
MQRWRRHYVTTFASYIDVRTEDTLRVGRSGFSVVKPEVVMPSRAVAIMIYTASKDDLGRRYYAAS